MIQNSQANIEVKNLDEMHVAYIRHVGPYKGDSKLFQQLFGKLVQWAAPRGLLSKSATQFISVYHDDPNITAEEKLRTSACMTVPQGTEVEGAVGKMTIPGGAYAIGHFEIAETEYEKAWTAMYGTWLPQSGYQPDDRPCFEMYHNDPKDHPEHKHIVDVCVPVKPL